jgi:flagellar basal body-associated protein FliL
MAENTKEEEQPAAKAPQGPSKLIPMILVANTVLMGAVLAVVLLRKPASAGAVVVSAAQTSSSNSTGTGGGASKEGGKEEGGGHGEGAGHGEGTPPADPNGAPGPILKLENFIIQLRGTDTDRYVRVAFDLELGAASPTGRWCRPACPTFATPSFPTSRIARSTNCAAARAWTASSSLSRRSSTTSWPRIV